MGMYTKSSVLYGSWIDNKSALDTHKRLIRMGFKTPLEEVEEYFMEQAQAAANRVAAYLENKQSA